jgi:hypothetical protein
MLDLKKGRPKSLGSDTRSFNSSGDLGYLIDRLFRVTFFYFPIFKHIEKAHSNDK